MEVIELDDMFQSIMIGTVSGVIAVSIVNRGTLYVMGISMLYWVFLILTFSIAIPVLRYIDKELLEDENEDQEELPYADVEYAS